MKRICGLLIALHLPSVLAAPLIVGVTIDCPREVRIEARNGQNVVHAIEGGRRHVLFPQGNYVFHSESQIPLTYDTFNRKTGRQGLSRYRYTHPNTSGKEGTLQIFSGPERVSCRVKLSRE
jgi:hypothetical protein